MMDIAEELIELAEQYKNHAIDKLEVVEDLQALQDKIAEDYNICSGCLKYKEIKHWEESHPYQEGYAAEAWEAYYCPVCGEED